MKLIFPQIFLVACKAKFALMMLPLFLDNRTAYVY